MPEPVVILVDQNISRHASDWLAAARPSWRIHHTFDLGLSRSTDAEVAAWATYNGAVVLTFDEDFADQRPDFGLQLRGIIRLRVWPTTDEEVVRALGRLLAEVADSQLTGSLVIVGRTSIRVRPWPPPAEPSGEVGAD
ncbi:MAG: DUF5615 family PIN-like protein [Dehalococcoidia bacterium]